MMLKPNTDFEVSFSYCASFAKIETKSAPWVSFANSVTKSIGYGSKEESIKRAMIIGGVREDETRGRADNVKTREIATLDYDNLAGHSLSDIELALELSLPDTSWLAYSTFRHTPESPRVRIMCPLSRSVSAAEYEAIITAIAEALDLGEPDPCSFSVSQGMFLASHMIGVEPWSAQGGTGVLDVDAMGLIIKAQPDADQGDVFDLDLAIAAQPLDITDEDAAALLENYPAEGLDYEEWLRCGMAIAHQTQKSDEGFQQWVNWSAQSSKHDAKQMRVKWRSFGGSGAPVTMASIIKAAGGLKGGAVAVVAGGDVARSLEDQAAAISTMAEYGDFKKRIQQMNAMQMPPDIRSMLAGIAHEGFAKGVGMGLREVKAAFKPVKAAAPARDADDVERIETPGWLADWVYDEKNCLFVNSHVRDYGIKREAFRARYDRQPICSELETDAATFALNYAQIPTVAQSVFWPNMGRFFTMDGKDCLNSYFPSGRPALEAGALEGDADGLAVVQLFLDHVAMLIEDERERNIFLDWLSYVYQNQGQRVRWAMLLWGIEGNGKTYFFKIMQLLMGENAKPILPSMVEGNFNDWAVGSILACVEEIRISGTSKYTILDKIKPVLSNDHIAVEPKGRAGYSAPNFTSYLMLTNHQDAIPISNNDRRYCVIFTKQQTATDFFEEMGGEDAVGDYFNRLFSESDRRVDAIGRWLLDRKQGAEFNPSGRAPSTKGIASMRVANETDDQIAVREALSDYWCDVINENIVDVTHLNACALADSNNDAVLPTGRALGNMMRDLGYKPVGPGFFKVKGQKHRVWIKGHKLHDEEARKIVQDYHSSVEFFDEPPM